MPYAIETAVLRAAMLSVSTEKTRYYLNGVHIGADGFIASTDGHRLFFGQLLPDSARPAKDFIIPLADLKAALARFKGHEIEFDETRIDRLAYTPIDGTFPDWRRVVPTECDGATAQFNGAFVGDIDRVATLLATYPVIHHNGDAPAGVSFATRLDCGAVLMPMRRKGVYAPICHPAPLAEVEASASTALVTIEAEPAAIAPQVEPEVKASRRKPARMARPVEVEPEPQAEPVAEIIAEPARQAPRIWADPDADDIAPVRTIAPIPMTTDRAAMLSARANKAVATRRANAVAKLAA